MRGTGTGWAAGVGRAGAVISPTLAGVMIGLGFSTSIVFLCFTLPALVAALCVKLVQGTGVALIAARG